MKRIVVLSNYSQWKEFSKVALPSDTVLCDNLHLEAFLEKEKILFERLDEFCIRSHWNEINAWGWRKAAAFIRVCRERGFFKDVGLPSVIYLWFTVDLILMLKNLINARWVLKKYQPEEVLVFKGHDKPVWPQYSGNAFLNHFLKEEAVRAKVKVQVLDVHCPMVPILPDTSSGVKKIARKFLKACIHLGYRAMIRPQGSDCVLVYGTLRHLAAPTLALKDKGHRVAFYDDEFRAEHFAFCRKNRVLYLIPGCFKRKKLVDPEGFSRSLRLELDRFWEDPAFVGLFSYEGVDLGGFVRDTFFSEAIDPFFLKLAAQADHYEDLFAACRPAALLLDEDFNAHAFIAEFMRRKNRPVFCVSHANMALDCKLSMGDVAFSQSETFVQAEHEKDTYIERGWLPEKLLTTGMPRYDRLIQMKQDRDSASKVSRPVQVLYCAGMLFPYSPDVLGFVGCDMFAFRNSQEKAVKMLLSSARGLNVSVIIKPHYAEDEAMWADLIKGEGAGDVAKVVSASEDYFKLLLESDAMVLCLWSSTLIEAGIADVPVFYLNIEGQNSSQAQRLAASGLCEIFSEPAALRQAIQNLKVRSREDRPPLRTPDQTYYLGDLDGKATERVANHITRVLRERTHV